MSGYQVDLDYLEQTFKQLKSVADQFDQPIACTQYNTAMAQSDIGQNFAEATYLYAAHNQMKSELADMLKYLQAMIDDFGKRTQQVHTNYGGQEQAVKADMSG